ncbi:MAG: ParB/RepB/Spo0J family partition protein [Rhodospirillales bacterium]|nr:ParB/RepB/Spo0J family partition protein [Rhodospirillales bacterium]
MVDAPKRQNLGRGLSALLGDVVAEPQKTTAPATLPIEFLRPGKYQPRHTIGGASLEELTQSIREKGILQPILVRRHPSDANAYEIIAGERRWRAAQAAQIHDVPVLVRELSDTEALEIALVENLQRQDLSPLEEADGYRRLMDEFAHTQEDLARVLGKSRSHVANMMRLLALPQAVKTLLESGALSAGHARALLGAKDPGVLAKMVVARGLNVRQTERLVQRGKLGRRGRAAVAKDADTVALELDLSTILGLRVEIRDSDGAGSLTLHYKTLEQLDDVLNRLKHVHEIPSPFGVADDESGTGR